MPARIMLELVDELTPAVVKLHDALDLYGCGRLVQKLRARGVIVLCDYKLNDTPTTMGLRAKALFRMGVREITVHASAGVAGMRAVLETDMKVWAVTVLTSMSDEEVSRVHGAPRRDVVHNLARLAADAEVHGVVCSGEEVESLRSASSTRNLNFLVPGVRSVGVPHHDQRHVVTPKEAFKRGAHRIVVGREATEARDPAAAWVRILGQVPRC